MIAAEEVGESVTVVDSAVDSAADFEADFEGESLDCLHLQDTRNIPVVVAAVAGSRSPRRTFVDRTVVVAAVVAVVLATFPTRPGTTPSCPCCHSTPRYCSQYCPSTIALAAVASNRNKPDHCQSAAALHYHYSWQMPLQHLHQSSNPYPLPIAGSTYPVYPFLVLRIGTRESGIEVEIASSRVVVTAVTAVETSAATVAVQSMV